MGNSKRTTHSSSQKASPVRRPKTRDSWGKFRSLSKLQLLTGATPRICSRRNREAHQWDFRAISLSARELRRALTGQSRSGGFEGSEIFFEKNHLFFRLSLHFLFHFLSLHLASSLFSLSSSLLLSCLSSFIFALSCLVSPLSSSPCLVLSLLFHLLLSCLSSFIFSCLVSPLSSSLVLSCLSFSVSLWLSLSLSPCDDECCVKLKKCGKKKTCVDSKNDPVCTGTTRICVSTCARGAGTHGDVSNPHTGGRGHVRGQ